MFYDPLEADFDDPRDPYSPDKFYICEYCPHSTIVHGLDGCTLTDCDCSDGTVNPLYRRR